MPAPSFLDVAKLNGSDDVVGIIEEAFQACPETRGAAFETIRGTSYKTAVRTAYPTAAFRRVGQGVAASGSTWVNRLVECFLFNPRWECDLGQAMGHEKGVGKYVEDEAVGVLEAALQALSSQFYYGQASPGSTAGFPGLIDLYDSTNNVVDAGGTTASTGSSVWLVHWDTKGVRFVVGNDGTLNVRDPIESRATDADGNPYTAISQEILGWFGLQLGSPKRDVVRIKKLTADTGKGLTDALMADALAKFPAGRMPTAIYMSRRSRAQLRKSRTAYNPTGAEAANPTEFDGIPIFETDAIIDTESLSL